MFKGNRPRNQVFKMQSIHMTGAKPAALSRMTRALTLAFVVGASACAAFSAQAQGMGMSMGGHEGRPGMMHFGGSPEHMGRGIDHMLDGLNATDAQRTQIKQIVQAAAADLKAQHEAGRAMHQKGMQIFAAANVDAAAAETLRQQMSAQHDQASKRMLTAMLDVSKVLTPEQRAKIGERMKNRDAQMQDRRQRMQHDNAARPARP